MHIFAFFYKSRVFCAIVDFTRIRKIKAFKLLKVLLTNYKIYYYMFPIIFLNTQKTDRRQGRVFL